MLYYPQLATGAAAQYPLFRVKSWQTLETVTSGRHASRAVRPELRRVTWQIEYRDLSDEEGGALEDLFRMTQGGLKTFLFVDPMVNLFRKSEALNSSSWMVDPSLALTGDDSQSAESRRSFRVTNYGQGPGSISQSLYLAPGSAYVMSCWIRAVSGQRFGMRVAGDGQDQYASGEWERFWVQGWVHSAAEPTVCELVVPAGGEVETQGMQLERQPYPSPYRASGSTSGIYPNTRFEQDSLVLVATGPNRNAARVRLISQVPE